MSEKAIFIGLCAPVLLIKKQIVRRRARFRLAPSIGDSVPGVEDGRVYRCAVESFCNPIGLTGRKNLAARIRERAYQTSGRERSEDRAAGGKRVASQALLQPARVACRPNNKF